MNSAQPPSLLKIPYALCELELLTSADSAIPGEAYRCPSCKKAVTLRQGSDRTAHFAHRPNSTCNPETVLHLTAKQLVAQAIQANAIGSSECISIDRPCEHCGEDLVTELPARTFTSAELEVPVGAYICDAVGYRGEKVALAVEVRHTHAMDDTKASGLSVPWIEISAEAVLQNPYHWTPERSHLKPSLCQPCKQKVRAIRAIADRWNIPRVLYSPIHNPERARFIAGKEQCFRCKQEIPVFWWFGVPFAEEEPPQPRPPTIQRRISKQYGGAYWANTCPQCKSIQGDNYLFLKGGAPLKSPTLPLRSQNQGLVQVEIGQKAVSKFMRSIFGSLP